jgi:hypothetical protein
MCQNFYVAPMISDAQLSYRPSHDFAGGYGIFHGGVAYLHLSYLPRQFI